MGSRVLGCGSEVIVFDLPPHTCRGKCGLGVGACPQATAQGILPGWGAGSVLSCFWTLSPFLQGILGGLGTVCVLPAPGLSAP